MGSNAAKAYRNLRWLLVTSGVAFVVLTLATMLCNRSIARPSRRMVCIGVLS